MSDLFNSSVDDDAAPYDREGPHEIVGAEEADDLRAVLTTARNNRQPAPPMRAVALEEARASDPITDWMTDVTIGAALAAADAGAEDPFPRTNQLLLRYGAGQPGPRYIRVDTEETYGDLAAANSPALAELRDRLDLLTEAFRAHAADPQAHAVLAEEVSDLTVLGAEHAEAEAEKEIEMALPPWADGKVKAWREDDIICATIALPGSDGRLRLVTAAMPVEDAVEEASRHAREADVDASAVIGALPAIGCVLGAATLVKEMCAAAPSILDNPQVQRGESCTLCIEPKATPSIAALMALYCACCQGDAAAKDEWQRLARAAESGGALLVSKAMIEACGRATKALKA